MTNRIDRLTPGQEVILKFHGSKSLGNEPHEETHTFLGIEGEGDERRAKFRYNDMEWEAYRYQGRWSYGTSAEKLSIVQA